MLHHEYHRYRHGDIGRDRRSLDSKFQEVYEYRGEDNVQAGADEHGDHRLDRIP